MENKHTVKTLCRFCRKEFDSFNLSKVCNDCESKMDDQFSIIRNFINDNPDSSIGDICNALDLPTALIKYYLKEERLSIKAGKNLFLKCEYCGIPISSGRYCRDCEIAVMRSDMKGKLSASSEITIMDKTISKFHIRKGIRHIIVEKPKKE